MSDNTNTPQSSSSKPCKCKPRRGRFGRSAVLLGTLAVGALIGGVVSKAHSQGPGWHGPWGHGFGSGITRAHGLRGFMRGPQTPEMAQKRAERLAKYLSISVDATPEQTAKLVEIAKSVAGDLAPVRGELRETRRAAVDMLTSDTFDRAALEKLRGEQVVRLDGVSKVLLSALADAAEVLTPEQRKQLRERVEHWREARHGWGGGWGRRGSHDGSGRGSHDGSGRGSY